MSFSGTGGTFRVGDPLGSFAINEEVSAEVNALDPKVSFYRNGIALDKEEIRDYVGLIVEIKVMDEEGNILTIPNAIIRSIGINGMVYFTAKQSSGIVSKQKEVVKRSFEGLHYG